MIGDEKKVKEVVQLEGINRDELLSEFQKLHSRIDALDKRGEKYFSKKETAELLNVHINTLDQWRAQGLLVPVKIGSRVLYKSSDIEQVINSNRVSK